MTAFSSSNDFTVTFGTTENYETLPGNAISTDRFKVTIPRTAFETPNPEFYVYVKAVPVDTGLHEIQALLYGSQNVVVTAAWSGTLAESNTFEHDYDFYNYVISGSGSGKLDIMWDPAWFDIDVFFFTGSLSGVNFDVSSLDGEGQVRIDTVSDGERNGWKKVTIVVDSTNDKSRYEIQLYKTKPNSSYTGEDDAAKHVYCELQP